MLARIFRQWKLFPITSLFVVISIALYVATRVYIDHGPPAKEPANTPSAQQAQLMKTLVLFGAVGLQKLWSGDWWRLVVSGFHHGFFLHLLGNVIAVALMGRLLETEFSRWWFLLFCLGSLMLTVIAEALVGVAAVGISGTGCAMLGLIIMHRRRDPELAWMVPKSAIWMGILSLLAGIPLQTSGALPIANLAHFTGLGYGILAGFIDGWKHRSRSHRVFLAMHLALVPLTLLAMQPTWTDAYKVMQLDNESTTAGQRIELLEQLLKENPDYPNYRTMLAESLFLEKQYEDSWRTALEGWNGNRDRAQRDLTKLIRELWSRLRKTEQREQYEAVMDELFVDKSDWAKERLDLAWYSVRAKVVDEYLELRDEQQRQEREPEPGEHLPDPDSPASASLGAAG